MGKGCVVLVLLRGSWRLGGEALGQGEYEKPVRALGLPGRDPNLRPGVAEAKGGGCWWRMRSDAVEFVCVGARKEGWEEELW